MATYNPYSGKVIHFPAGTPASVMAAYYNAVLRNQALAAQYAQNDPWSQTIEGFQKQVLNPFLSQWLNQGGVDYRSTYDTNEKIRQQAELYNSQVEAQRQEALNKYALQQQMETDLGTATAPFLQAMGPSPDQQYVPPPPVPPAFPTTPAGMNPYAAPDVTTPPDTGIGAGPEPITPPSDAAAMGPGAYREANISPPMPGPVQGPPLPLQGTPTDWGAPPASAAPGKTVVNQDTGERWVSDGTVWTPTGQQTASAPPYQGPAPMPPAAPPAAPPSAGPLAGAAPTPTVPSLPNPRPFQANPQTSMLGALRTVAATDPLATGKILDMLKNQKLTDTLNPLSQENIAAQIAQRLATAGLTGEKAVTEGVTREPRVAGIEAGTNLRVQQAESLRMRNETVAKAMEDYQQGRIGKEELAILVAAAYGRAGGAGAAQQTDTKTFLTALASVKADPQNAGKSDAELRPLAAQWLQDQAQAIATKQAMGRAQGEFAAGMQPPPAAQIDKHTGFQQASSQLGEISLLVPRVDLNKFVGGISPWLNQIAQRGATQQWGPVPPIPIPEGMRRSLNQDELRFLALTQDYADVVLRLRSGAQINQQEMSRMLDFLPTQASTPEAFRSQLSTAFDSMDRWMQMYYRSSKDYGYRVPPDSQKMQSARRVLKNNNRAYDDANVRTFLGNNPGFTGEEP